MSIKTTRVLNGLKGALNYYMLYYICFSAENGLKGE